MIKPENKSLLPDTEKKSVHDCMRGAELMLKFSTLTSSQCTRTIAEVDSREKILTATEGYLHDL